MQRRTRRAHRAARQIAFEALEDRRLFAAVAWTGAGDGINWSDPSNWSSNAMPTASDDVTLNVAGTPSIQVTGSRSVKSLNNAESLALTGGATLAIATTASSTQSINLNGGTISGGAWSFSGGAGVNLGNATNTITGATINGDLFFSVNSARTKIEGGTTFTTAHLAADSTSIGFAPGSTLTGTILFEGSGAQGRYVEGNGSVGTLTIGASGAIKTATGFAGFANLGSSFWFGGNMTLNNVGLISSEVSGKSITINPSTLTNSSTCALNGASLNLSAPNWSSSGTISAVGSTLNFNNSWSNSGAINIDSSTLALAGTFSTAGLNVSGWSGTGGTVNLTGTLNNASSSITFDNTIGSWNLSGGTISGGQMSYANGQMLNFTSSGGVLNNVAVNGDLSLGTDNAHVALNGSTTFNNAHLIGNSTSLGLQSGYTLNGTIQFEGSGTQGRYVEGYNGSGTVTIGATGAIKTAAGFAGTANIGNAFWFGSPGSLVNNGLIQSNISGRSLTVGGSSFTNNATVDVSNGTLNLSSINWNNAASGAITANSSTVKFSGTWSNPGTLSVTNSPLTLGGMFSTSSFNFAGFSRSGIGAVDLTGTLDNANATLTLNGATGAWNLLGGTVNGGQLNSMSAQTLAMTGTGGVLNNVAVLGDISADMNNAHVRVAGSTSFNTVHLINDSTAVGFDAGYTLNSAIVFEGTGTQGRYVEVAGNGTLTVGAGGSIKTASGFAATANVGAAFWFGGQMTLVDNGLIRSETAGKVLNIAPAGGATINGILRGINGGICNVDTNGSVSVTSTGSADVTHFRINALTIDGAASVVAGGGNNGCSVVKSLTFNGSGSIDLNDNDLMINYTGTSPLPALQAMINQGRNGGAWNGVSPIHSTSAQLSPAKNTTLAAMEGVDFKAVTGLSTFDNQPVSNTCVIVKYTYYGDTDFNGKVDGADYARIDAKFNQQATQGNIGGWSNGDFDANGKVDGADYALIDAAFNSQGQQLRPGQSPFRKSI